MFTNNVYFPLLLFSFAVVVLVASVAERSVQFIITIICTSNKLKNMSYVKSAPLGFYAR